jgi:4-hydroxy-tetrahydrodipicolinate synthase
MIPGSLVAIVTPMHPDGSLDLPSYRRLIEWHIREGTSAIVAVGTTGESATVDPDEHIELIKVAVQTSAGRVKVIAGAGANSTREAIELTTRAKAVGADATLQVVPYYNRPTQEGMYRHFRAVAEAVDLPVILYNVPSRTVADLAVDTVMRLTEVPGIIGIKDASGDLSRPVELRRRGATAFLQYSGNDDSALAFVLLGGHGVISVTANVAPGPMAQLIRAALDGDLPRARQLNEQLMPLHQKLFVEPNPVPVKWALAHLGRMPAGLRLPLAELSPAFHEVVARALNDSGVRA